MSLPNIIQNSSRHFKSPVVSPVDSQNGNLKSASSPNSHEQIYQSKLAEIINIIEDEDTDDEAYDAACERLFFLADEKYAPAEYYLGCSYLGEETIVNQREATYWLQRAADQGHAEAQSDIGCAHMYGRGGMEVSFEQARKWFTLSAASECASGMFNLAVLYMVDESGKRDYEKAAKLFEGAAHKGHLPSQLSLGSMYENGLGVDLDVEEAFYWTKKSADGGWFPAESEMIRKCALGIGTRVDYLMAADYASGFFVAKATDMETNQ